MSAPERHLKADQWSMLSLQAARAQLGEAMRSAGLPPPQEIIADGTIHRFPTNSRPGDKAGWYVMYPDGVPAGRFGCWRTEVDETWRADVGRSLTDAEKEDQLANVAAAKQLAKVERTKARAEAAKEASRIWDAADSVTEDHPYLRQKQIKAHGVRQRDGQLVVPVRVGNELRSLQFIAPNGNKLFLSGGEVKGGYFGIGTITGATALCLAEGYATASTVHEATGHPVAVSFNCANLLSVAKAFRERFPELPMIVCGDDDYETEGNPGRTKAIEAAKSVGARVAMPLWGSERPNGATDFNDLRAHYGPVDVQQAIDAAIEPETVNVEVEKWPELISLDTPELPRLDLKRLPTWAGDYAAALAASTETPPELTGGLTISTCSAAAARRLQVAVRPGHVEPCNLWIAPALPSGNRKSAVESATSAPLSEWERGRAAELRPEIVRVESDRKTLEARAKELRNRSAKEEDQKAAQKLTEEVAEIEANLPDDLPP